jgi:peptidoglycan/LPS O-acetylase OafA/YrhL
LFLSPIESQQVSAKTAIATVLLGGNVAIARSTGDYFALPAQMNPLLHVWSLSVEEQFYLVFPPALALGWWLRGRNVSGAGPALVTVAVGLMPLLLAEAVWAGSAGSTRPGQWLDGFYSPLTRTWEFAAGALPAVLVTRDWRPRHGSVMMSVLGVALCAASVVFINERTPFPSAWFVAPVLGIVLLLVGGLTANAVSRCLSLRWLVEIGDRSYAIYLWHWPAIVFAGAIWPDSPLAPALAALGSLLPAYASHRVVERPIHIAPLPAPHRMLRLALLTTVLPLICAVAVRMIADNYWVPRLASRRTLAMHEGEIGRTGFIAAVSRSSFPCTDQTLNDIAYVAEGIRRCYQSHRSADVQLALIGDSHADHLFPGLARTFPETNIASYFYPGIASEDERRLAMIVQRVADTPSIHTVIVSLFWARGTVDPDRIIRSLGRLRASGKRLFITDDVPRFAVDAAACKYQQAPALPTPRCSIPRAQHDREVARYAPVLDSILRAVPGLTLLRTALWLCDDHRCDMTSAGRMLYRDQDHLNVDGSVFVAQRLAAEYPELRASLAR